MTAKQVTGYALFVFSFLAWAAIFATPLLELSLRQAAVLTSGLLIAAEVSFFLSIVLLGKPALDKFKAIFRRKKS